VIYRKESQSIYSGMKMLWDNGFSYESKIKIPEPISFLEDLGILVLEKVRGRQLRRYLNQKGPAALARMKAVSRWLAKLHYLKIDLAGITPHPDEESTLRAFVRHVWSIKFLLDEAELFSLAVKPEDVMEIPTAHSREHI
jgi:hypothetical protein